MTAPDAAPTAEDVVMFAMHDARCSDRCDRTVIGSTFGREAAAVVAAIRAMTTEQLVDLRPDFTVERHGQTRLGERGRFVRVDVARVVGPWQETP